MFVENERCEMNKKLSIKEVCSEFGLSEVYVRRMILKGKLKSEKVEIAKNTYKHLIERDEVVRWRKTSQGRGSRRDDGRNKFTIYGTPDEISKLQKLLETNKLQTPIKRSNEKRVNIDESK